MLSGPTSFLALGLCLCVTGARAQTPEDTTGTPTPSPAQAPVEAGAETLSTPPADGEAAAPTAPSPGGATPPPETDRPPAGAPDAEPSTPRRGHAAPAASPGLSDSKRGPYPKPGRPPPGLPPARDLGDEAYGRFAVELIPHLGPAWPRCQPGEQSSRNCIGTKLGADLGFTALWRVSAYFAWGGTLGIGLFQYEPPDAYGREHGSAAAVSLLLLARGYFLDEGSIDPYVQLGLGGGALGTAFDETVDGAEEHFEETGAGPALQIGAGIDFYLTRHVRLGPALTVTQVSIDKVRRCTGGGEGDCEDLPKEDDGYLDAYFSASARLTIGLGEEL